MSNSIFFNFVHTFFAGNGLQCQDIDECAAGNNNCHEKAKCENTQGSYTCTCVSGYEGNGESCQDIDECARGLNDCNQFSSRCVNLPGTFTCQSKGAELLVLISTHKRSIRISLGVIHLARTQNFPKN